MKKIALLIVFAFSITLVFSQQEIELLPDGIVIPRITNAQRPSSPSIGHLVFNTDQDQFEYFDGSSWSPINSDGAISDKIQDADNDTEISLEEGTLPTDQDFIRFSIDNQPSMVMQRLNSDAGSRIYFPGSLNSFIGFNTGLNTQSVATDNIGIGFNALRNNQTSDFNIAIGTDALKNLNTSDDASPFGGKNVSIGYKSLEQAGQTATSNVAIGYEAGSTGSGMSKSVFIGNQAGKNATSTDNTLYI
ncbi:MAG: hypothetical protein OEQ53_08810, partial [Saprospiraceae bacterium]|nr:hypothetical protein [Saprospiraceae bacterium]